jgi:outer membrane protein assembly factor BamD
MKQTSRRITLTAPFGMQWPVVGRRLARAAIGGMLAVAALGLSACRHAGTADITTLAAGSDRVLWDSGNKALQKKQYPVARQYFTRLIENFPSSPQQPQARLARADSYLQEGGTENYVSAAKDYREFTSLFPSHPRADYAQMQLAECYFKQKLGPDRDQTNTAKALEEYQRLLSLFPTSALADQARERAKTCRWSLARAEYNIGFFYQRTRQSCRAAVQRYQGLLAEYADYSDTDEVLFRLAECLVRMGRASEALPAIARLLDNYPGSRYRESAEHLRQEANAAPTPSPSPTPAAPRQ